jgi:hypothetical protein
VLDPSILTTGPAAVASGLKVMAAEKRLSKAAVVLLTGRMDCASW